MRCLYNYPLLESGGDQEAVFLNQMDQLLSAVMDGVIINGHQCRHVHTQVRSLCRVLQKMPDPAPTAGIFGVLRSAVFLLELMGGQTPEGGSRTVMGGNVAMASSDGGIFAADEERRMKKSRTWFIDGELEAGEGEADREWAIWLSQRFTCLSFFSAWADRFHSAWTMRSAAQTLQERLSLNRRDEEPNAAILVAQCAPTLQQLRQVLKRREEWCGGPVFPDDSEVDASVEDVVRFYRDWSGCGGWKILFEELDWMRGAAGTVRFSSNEESSPQAKFIDGRCFRIVSGLAFKRREVLVDMLSLSPVEAAECEPWLSETLTNFVQDAVVRVARWCSPFLVGYIGAFTEKLCSEEMERAARSEAQTRWSEGSNQSFFPVAVADASASRSIPRSTLGLVYSFAPFHRESFGTLHHYLYEARYAFSFPQAAQIILDLSEALQYMCSDSTLVPRDVVVSWLTLEPSRVFVAFPQHTGSERLLVKYAPPCSVKNGSVSRWRPHPRACTPLCYVLAQLLLSILSHRIPYEHGWADQKKLLEGVAEEDDDFAVKEGLMPGMYISPQLPHEVKAVCAKAMSLNDKAVPLSLTEFNREVARWAAKSA